MLLYYITDRRQFAGSEAARCAALLERIAEAARAGVDYIQLREKDLDADGLAALAREAVVRVRAANAATRLLVNSYVEIARAAGADGVHLTSHDLRSDAIRELIGGSPGQSEGSRIKIGASCHTSADVRVAESLGADFAVLAPIFEKPGADVEPLGIAALAEIARTSTIPLLALGGVSLENAAECMRAGAAGVAGIRLFQQGDVAETLRKLRALRG